MKEKADFCFDGERSARVFVRRQHDVLDFSFPLFFRRATWREEAGDGGLVLSG